MWPLLQADKERFCGTSDRGAKQWPFNSRVQLAPAVSMSCGLVEYRKENAITNNFLSVLLVEGNCSDAACAVGELNRAGFKVSAHVVSSEKAFRRQLAFHTFDLVLADASVHGWSGIEMLEVLKEVKPDIPLIIISETAADSLAVECVKRGAADHLRKSDMERLPVVVGSAVKQKSLK